MFIENWGLNKVITAKDIQKNRDLHDNICSAIQIWYDNSEQAQSEKRTYHKAIDEAVKQLHSDDRLEYDMLWSYKKSFIAMFQSEWLSPVFKERDYFDREVARKLNKISDFDIENMKKNIKDKKMLSDVFDYGVGLRVYNGFDKVNKCPTFITPSPLSWYYDPNGSVSDVDFDYHLFHFQTSKADLNYTNLLTGDYFCLDEVRTGIYSRSAEIQDAKRYRKQTTDEVSDDTVYVYNCFLTVNGHRYFCVVANDQTKIIKWERMMPETKEEKKDGTLVPFKISISNAFIDQYDAWGVSYREKIYPVQNAITRIVNAMHSKQLRDAGHDVILYDIDRVENPANLLERPSGWPLFVAVNELGSWPVTAPALENNDTSRSQQYIQQLEYYAENTTALTGIVRGLTPDAWTLGEAEIQMQKSNALFSVDAETLTFGEKNFWTNIYYRSLKENMSQIGDKAVTLWVDGGDIVNLSKRELSGFNTPNVTVKSKRKEAENRNKKVATMQAQLPLIMQDPKTSDISKTLYQRELMELQWLDSDFIMAIHPMSPDERHAEAMQDIINMDKVPENLIIPGIDLDTLWVYINAAVDNDSKQTVLTRLNALIIEKWLMNKQAPEQQGQMQGVANSMASQALSSDIAQRQKDLPIN